MLAIPPGFTNIVAGSAKGNHGLAVTADGAVVAGGTNFAGESTVPLNMPNVVAIAGGQDHSIALLRDGSPRVTVQPWDLAVASGGLCSFLKRSLGMGGRRPLLECEFDLAYTPLTELDHGQPALGRAPPQITGQFISVVRPQI